MKKITFFLGLLLSLIGVSVEAQTITISDAPNDGKFTENTQWYLIKSANSDNYHNPAFISNESGKTSDTYGFLLSDTSIPTSEGALWCIVGNETDGYSFYNKEAGTGKVLGFSGSIAKLYETGSSDADVLTFDIAASTSSKSPFGYCVKFHGKTDGDYWWNNADTPQKHLAYWTNSNSTTSTDGNAFFFIPVDEIGNAKTAATDFIALKNIEYTYNSLKAIVPSVETSCSAEYTAIQSSFTFENAKALAKAVANAVDGKAFRFQNGRGTDNVLYAKDGYALITPDTYLKTNVGDLWSFKVNDFGRICLYNINTKSYMGALSTSYDPGAKSTAMTSNQDDAEGFTLTNTTQTPNWVITDIYEKRMCGDNSEKNYRINNWSGNEEANRWTITEATSLEVALASVDGQTNTYASAYLPVSVSSVSGATAYLGALSEDNSTLKMTAATAGVPAETGFVLVGESGATTATLTLGESTTSASDNSLTGTLSAITLGDDNPRANYLAFGVNSGTVGFYTPSSSVATIPANKAFIDATKLSASAIAMQFGNTPTGISNATIATAGAAAPVFDLSGRRVANPAKGGIYIQNGKKFVK